jgi:hypothetical protein
VLSSAERIIVDLGKTGCFMNKMEMLLGGLFHPSLAISNLLRRLPVGPFEFRLALDGVKRPNYGYAMMYAAKQAKNLGVKKISAIEFGVATGNGLIAMERLAESITGITGIDFEIVGFDMGTGLPAPLDYRDLPYIFKGGFYKMDVKGLRERLKKTTRLVLGDIRDTLPDFMKTPIPPLGFAAFDLDFYSSTTHALNILCAGHDQLLPRVYCYFDDTIGAREELYNEYTGELLAIREFNQRHDDRKIALIHGLIDHRIIKSSWCRAMYALHVFNHPFYSRYVPDRQDDAPFV